MLGVSDQCSLVRIVGCYREKEVNVRIELEGKIKKKLKTKKKKKKKKKAGYETNLYVVLATNLLLLSEEPIGLIDKFSAVVIWELV